MQNDMDNYLRDLARSCAKEAFEKAKAKASRSDYMGINSGKVAKIKIVVNNRKGADDMLLSLAAKAESATSLPELIPIHKAVYSILETVDCPLQRAHLGPDEYGMFRSASIPELNQDTVTSETYSDCPHVLSGNGKNPDRGIRKHIGPS